MVALLIAFAVEIVPGEMLGFGVCHLAVGDLDAFGVGGVVKFGGDGQAGAGGGARYQVDDDFVAGQRLAAPVHRDLAEQPVFDLVPLGGAWREVADGDRQPGLGCQFDQFTFPQPQSVAVGTAAVGGDQQPVGSGVGGAADPFPSAADLVPPAADRLDRERAGVVIGSHRHPAGVGGDVIYAVGG
jgi:hypothetical protein